MTKHSTLLCLILVPGVLSVSLLGCGRAKKPTTAQSATITVAMEDCKAERRGRITSETSTLRLLLAGPPKDELVKRGTVEVDGQKYNLYLPKAKSYSITNTKPGEPTENTSTLISVDANGDGRLADEECWFADLPLRLGDKMFDVAEIAADGGRIMLQPSKSQLRGVIVGRTCPSFSFRTADGQEISSESLAGKPFLLDIWSIT